MPEYEWQSIAASDVHEFPGAETRIEGQIEFAGTDKENHALILGWIFDPNKIIKDFVLIRQSRKGFFKSSRLEFKTIGADSTQAKVKRIPRADVSKAKQLIDPGDLDHGIIAIFKKSNLSDSLGLALHDGRYLKLSSDDLISPRDIRIVFQILWPTIGKFIVDLFDDVLNEGDAMWRAAHQLDQRFDSHTNQPQMLKQLRLDCSEVERKFVSFKNRIGEVNESIVPVINCDHVVLPRLVDRPLNTTEIVQLTECAPWGYSFPITDNLTAFNLDQFANQTLQPSLQDVGLSEMQLRMSVFTAILKDFSEPTDNWLDIATNCGVIPLLSQKMGYCFKTMVGIDYQKENIRKAELLKTLADITNVDFIQADAFGFTGKLTQGQYEIVSALGLFYHLSDPLSLLTELFRVTKRILVIGTIVHNFDFSGWIQTISRHTQDSGLSHANDARKIIELHPTFRGMVDSLFQVGFSNVIEFKPSKELLKLCPSSIYEEHNATFLVAFKI